MKRSRSIVRELNRRNFLTLVSRAGLGVAGLGAMRILRRPHYAAYPFSLGVASGDPLPDGVLLWTRLAPDPLRGGGMPPVPVEVEWSVAEDEGLSRVMRRGRTVALPDRGHAVHVEVDGLRPDRWYWYQFRSGAAVSPVGRTRTTPAAGRSADRLRFAFVSCQHYEQGYFTAYRHLAAEELDLVAHLGDYIYEYAAVPDRLRLHAGREIESIEDYRNRYALYKLDPDLQAAHAACPWLVTPDDHEVDNNFAGVHPEDDQSPDAFLRRRANAYRAFYEHLPLRPSAMPRGHEMRVYRRVDYGDLARFFVLDTRQYRTDQPCGDRIKPPCPDTYDPTATLLGEEQESWLLDGLDQSPARWNVLAQQIMMAHVDRAPGPEERYSMDQWSGYDASRTRLLSFLRDRRPSNPIVLTGDIHINWVNELHTDGRDRDSPVVAAEFVGTSISSGGDGADLPEWGRRLLAENPFVKFFNGQRGYVRCEVTAQGWRSDYRTLPYVTRPDAPIGTRASFIVEDGRAGVIRL